MTENKNNNEKSNKWLTIGLAILAVLGTLGGTILGSNAEKNNESKKWRRDQRLQAYIDFLDEAEKFNSQTEHLYRIQCDSTKKFKRGFDPDLLLGLTHSKRKIILIGTQQTQDAAIALFDALSFGRGDAENCPGSSLEQQRKIFRYINEKYNSFIASAKNDLGIFEESNMKDTSILMNK